MTKRRKTAAPRYKALIHASELLTGQGVRVKDGRKPVEADLGAIPDGAIVYRVRKVGRTDVPDKIEWVGRSDRIPAKFARVPKTDLKGQHAVIPGLIDCHTHLVFAGDRSAEFARRCAGATYEEIAAGGGGIAATVDATRKASISTLENLAAERVKEAMRFGVHTLEAKSGYGLDTDSELKLLEIIPRLRKRFPQMTFVSTFLGAHAFPEGCSREEYLRELSEDMLPMVASRKLAEFCDVFIDEGYYTREEGRHILERARALGFKLKIHADELGNTESASLAAHLRAHSADHLLRTSESGIQDLARSDTTAVLLPGTAFYLKAQHAPARKLIDAGARVAIATDFNPGTCMTLSLPSVMTIAALYLQLTRAEIFAAVTFNAAKALALDDRKGTLEAGFDADFSILPFARFEDAYYRFAWAPRN